MEKYFTYFNILVVVLFLGIMALGSSNNNEPIKSSDIPCQNLDVLNSVKEIMHWEILMILYAFILYKILLMMNMKDGIT